MSEAESKTSACLCCGVYLGEVNFDLCNYCVRRNPSRAGLLITHLEREISKLRKRLTPSINTNSEATDND